MERTLDSAELPALDGWLPIRVAWNEAPPLVDWCHLGSRRFLEPFFERTIEKCLREPFNLLFRHRTPFEDLAQWQKVSPGLPPDGFIFHMSRCGSTLIAQMLAALPQNVVISEAPPIDAILRRPFQGRSEEEQAELLRGLVSALGQRRSGEEKRFFVKFDSWNTLSLGMVRRAFPNVPWVFLYRHPLEVMASQLNNPGVNMFPGFINPPAPGAEVVGIAEMSQEERCARQLSRICAAAVDQLREGGLAMNYADLPEAVWTTLGQHFRLEFSVPDLERMRATAQFDAKNPSLFFDSDSTRKKETLTPLAREMSGRWLEPIYAELEALRKAQDQLKTAS